jgi:hypothetical protein
MKYYNNIYKTVFALGLIAGCLSSCKEDIDLSGIIEDNYVIPQGTIGYVVGSEGKMSNSSVELRTSGNTALYFSLTNDATSDLNATFTIDDAVLESYNKVHGTNYKLFPKELVSLENGGVVTVAKGAKKSTPLEIKIKSKEDLDANVTYVIPVKVKAEGVILSQEASSYLIFVNDYSKIPDCSKSTGIKIISCMEVNDTNPLNNLCFTLKGSGKPLVDMVILFSANINYSEENGRVYVLNNPNVQHLLSNRLKYIKPLQDRGIKVILGILGNHDRSGIANLSPITAKAFAHELKGMCDAYKLDGVFFDDEYSNYQYPAPAGFVTPSNDAAARLAYETKQAMPNKIVSVYVYGRTSRFSNPIEGVQAGNYVDYAIHDYGGSSDLSKNYPGLSKKGMALSSQEYSREYFADDSDLENIRKNGYGAHMIFAMDPNRDNFDSQLSSLKSIAKILFDDELVYSGKPYPKDWK